MLNKTVLQGRLTADPALAQTASGVTYINFTVAWSEKRNEVEQHCFLRCTAWQKTAEFISKYFRKGQELVVEGKLLTRTWVDDSGNNRSATDLTVDSVHFCGSKQQNTIENNGQNTSGAFTQSNTLPNGSDFASSVDESELLF